MAQVVPCFFIVMPQFRFAHLPSCRLCVRLILERKKGFIFFSARLAPLAQRGLRLKNGGRRASFKLKEARGWKSEEEETSPPARLSPFPLLINSITDDGEAHTLRATRQGTKKTTVEMYRSRVSP